MGCSKKMYYLFPFRYHLSAKQGYRYWWEDPDDTSAPKRISGTEV